MIVCVGRVKMLGRPFCRIWSGVEYDRVRQRMVCFRGLSLLALSAGAVFDVHKDEVVAEFQEVVLHVMMYSTFLDRGPVKGLDHQIHTCCQVVAVLYVPSGMPVFVQFPVPWQFCHSRDSIRNSCTPAAGACMLLCLVLHSGWAHLEAYVHAASPGIGSPLWWCFWCVYPKTGLRTR